MARLKTEGSLAWPWVIPYALLAVGVAAFFLKFYLRLGRRYQVLFGLAAMIYVTGAIGFEMMEAAHAEKHGIESLGFGILYSIEETLEMLAVILANWTIMTYAVEHCPDLRLELKIT